MILFTLSMPSISSWNGQWSGSGQKYQRVRRLPKEQELALDGGRFTYAFGDGWVACVTTTQIDAKAAAKVRRQTDGFCGYDWMVNSIVKHGEIRTGDSQ